MECAYITAPVFVRMFTFGSIELFTVKACLLTEIIYTVPVFRNSLSTIAFDPGKSANYDELLRMALSVTATAASGA